MSTTRLVRGICIAVISVGLLAASPWHSGASRPVVTQASSQHRYAIAGAAASCRNATTASSLTLSTHDLQSSPSHLQSIMTPDIMASSATGSMRSAIPIRNSDGSDINPPTSAGVCRTRMVMPVADAPITNAFDRPATRWSSGHRGVDIASSLGTPLIAPDDGVIAFSGTVAGKSVVSIAHDDGLTSTFEPATSEMEIGEHVGRSRRFGFIAEGLSDHCLDICVHWGVMDASGEYLDPSLLVLPRSVALKPV